ncbi:tRNA 2-thiocytidine(32) synthetase TtcA [Shewanella sp. D64]|uniref:tRNA 2-thiocytidine(32) synthetase TtcA n=1 Tax=unclassified Shewanella TaxID=196818 RepID=UPI0022BA1E49|nr:MULTISPECIES: tRNA 2-thiocytidine(32) synthetase TtcA [unclassified Shewanella]MEC4724024.1 tRNA 2-thiocytidine(32) synthetase TtcA [Shewanella sp. D64]MEC4736044.1 tRNA 2-thiocytidine(32) synthetase TtcA [Shewanella sp. E94]WBJ98011.1 tRNA 2-thiocytidine(32) synthetase TtcA [Shewanella sp. MTB7]
MSVDLSTQQVTRMKKLQKKLRSEVGKAISDYNMVEEGDRVMCCLSGGKDSYAMLDILLDLQKRAPIKFEIVAVNLDQKQPGFPEHVLPAYLDTLDVAYHILEKDTYSIVRDKTPEGQKTCSLCSRLRRGTLYGFAQKIGATKIALGHHRDDIIETLFLNMFFAGKQKAMPPKLLSDDGANMVIRPLAYSREKEIAEYAELKSFPIIPCNLCGSQENLKRASVKKMLNQWDVEHPGRIESIFTAMQNTSPSQGVDRTQFDFVSLSRNPDAPLKGEVAESDLPAFDFVDVSNNGHIDLDAASNKQRMKTEHQIDVVSTYTP